MLLLSLEKYKYMNFMKDIDEKGNMSDLFTDDSNLLSLSRQVVSISLACEQNQVLQDHSSHESLQMFFYLQVEAHNEAWKGAFNSAH